MTTDSPTKRSLDWLREQGYEVDVVERYSQYSKKRNDCYGFADMLAYHVVDRDIVLVQTTTGSHHAEHKHKMLAERRALGWLRAGGRVLLLTWRKLKVKRGGKATRWTARVEWLTEADFTHTEDEEHE